MRTLNNICVVKLNLLLTGRVIFIQKTSQAPTLGTKVNAPQVTPKNFQSDTQEHKKKLLESIKSVLSAKMQTLQKLSNTENNTKLLKVNGKRKKNKHQQKRPPKQTESYGYTDESNNRYGSLIKYSVNCKINAGGFIYYLNEDEYGGRECEEDNQYADHPEYIIVNGVRYYRKKKPKRPKKKPNKRPADKYCSNDDPSNKYSSHCNPFKIIKKKKIHIFNNVITNFKQSNVFG